MKIRGKALKAGKQEETRWETAEHGTIRKTKEDTKLPNTAQNPEDGPRRAGVRVFEEVKQNI